MRGDDADAVFGDVRRPHLDEVHIFTAIIVIHLVARIQPPAEFKGLISMLFRRLFDIIARFPLRLCAVDEFPIPLRVIENFLHQLVVRLFVNVRSLISQIAHYVFLLIRKFLFF